MMKLKASTFILVVMVQVLAMSLAFAEETIPVTDPCKDTLPALEISYNELSSQLSQERSNQAATNQEYFDSFNQMTDILFKLTDMKVLETQQIVENRDALKDSLTKFNIQRDQEAAKALQDSYFNLTVRLYSALMDSQKKLDGLKSGLAQVESRRTNSESSKQKLDEMDRQKLALEGPLVSLKIRCQPTNP